MSDTRKRLPNNEDSQGQPKRQRGSDDKVSDKFTAEPTDESTEPSKPTRLNYVLLAVIFEEFNGGNSTGLFTLDADKLDLPKGGLPQLVHKEELQEGRGQNKDGRDYNPYEDIGNPDYKRFKEVLNNWQDHATPFEDLPPGSRHLQTVTLDGGHRGRWGLRGM